VGGPLLDGRLRYHRDPLQGLLNACGRRYGNGLLWQHADGSKTCGEPQRGGQSAPGT